MSTRVITERVAAYTLEDNGVLIMSPRKQKEIVFEHIELDEEVPPGTQELVEKMLAKALFQVWLEERSSLKPLNDQQPPSQIIG
jgi:hypothetical protein